MATWKKKCPPHSTCMQSQRLALHHDGQHLRRDCTSCLSVRSACLAPEWVLEAGGRASILQMAWGFADSPPPASPTSQVQNETILLLMQCFGAWVLSSLYSGEA